MRFYCQKDSRYMTQNLRKEQDEEKKMQLAYFGPRTLGRLQQPIDRGINLLVALYDALLNTSFVSTTRF